LKVLLEYPRYKTEKLANDQGNQNYYMKALLLKSEISTYVTNGPQIISFDLIKKYKIRYLFSI